MQYGSCIAKDTKCSLTGISPGFKKENKRWLFDSVYNAVASVLELKTV